MITQPFNRVVWPWEPVAGAPMVWDTATALRLPAVARASAVYSGLIKQAPLDDIKGIDPQTPRPRLLEQPDPNAPRSWFMQVNVEDYLWNGNAVQLVTARDVTGWPAAVTWVPTAWVSIACPRRRYDQPSYLVDGIELPAADVIHIRRGADRWCPARGVGVVEQHLATFDRAALEEQYERDALRSGAVPSVAIITPNPRLGETEASTAKADWLNKFVGPGREPAILPAGTQVIPLAWSPTDAQLEEARRLTLLDIANAFNLDGYWLGAPAGSMTYRSPGSMYTNLVRVSLEGVLTDFEDVWSIAWLPRGRRVRFDRAVLLRDDMQTMVATAAAATAARLWTVEEARVYTGLAPVPTLGTLSEPAPAPAPAPTEGI